MYNNTIEENVVQGNGLGGVTLHAHLPSGQYMSGNRVVRNFFATNNVAGDQVDTDVLGSPPPARSPP